jgi:pyrroline-5-carboxylate reductase
MTEPGSEQEQRRFAVVGGGRMGEALVAGWLSAGVLGSGEIVIAEPVAERRAALESRYEVACVADGSEALAAADTVLLAVKPQVIEQVVSALGDALGHGVLVISIAAGVSTARLEALLPEGTSVVRVMPNTPALVGAGMAVVSGGESAAAWQVERVRELFDAVGHAVVLEERFQDAATALSGSGPAYFALIVDLLARAGVHHGLSRDVAQRLAVETMRGTAELLEHTGLQPQEVIDSVASPGGTTIAALEAMQGAGLPAAISEGVAAAVKRAGELGS